jgi:hypothetical protein
VASLTDRIRPRNIGAAVLVALALVLVLVVPSEGEVQPDLLVPSGSGLSEPGGLVKVNGQLWVADGLLGVCRVDTDADAVIQDDFCRPEGVEAEPPAASPPGAVGLSYDPVSSNFYVGDPSSKATGVWKLHLDTVTGLIDSAAALPDTAVDRITALTLADENDDGAAELYFAVKRSATIYRVVDPAGSPQRQVAGFASDEATPSLAALDSPTTVGATLFLAEADGVTQLELPSGVPTTATPVPGAPVAVPGGVPNALAVDAVRNRLYAGTMNENLVDQVDALDLGSGAMETFATGFSGISAMLVDTDGGLLVGDDPSVASGAGEAGGQARLWKLALTAFNTPRTTIDAAPPTFTNQTDLTFDFSSRAGTTFECSLDDAPWTPCGGVASGSITYPGLADGPHPFQVRAVDPDPAIGTGPAVRRTVVVDTVTPSAFIENGQEDSVVEGDRLTMSFSANEQGVRYTCMLDGGAPEPCDSPFWLSNLALGDHVFSVTPTDFAGNAGTAAEFAFTVVEPPAPPPPVPGDDDDDDGGGSSGPGGGDSSGSGTPRTVPDGGDIGPVVLRARVATLSRTRIRQRQLRSRPIGIAFNAPGPARYARITIQPYGRNTPILAQRGTPSARILMRLTAPIEGGRRNYIRWRLTRRQARRLRVGRYRVTIALGQTRRSFGPQKVLTMRVIGRG